MPLLHCKVIQENGDTLQERWSCWGGGKPELGYLHLEWLCCGHSCPWTFTSFFEFLSIPLQLVNKLWAANPKPLFPLKYKNTSHIHYWDMNVWDTRNYGQKCLILGCIWLNTVVQDAEILAFVNPSPSHHFSSSSPTSAISLELNQTRWVAGRNRAGEELAIHLPTTSPLQSIPSSHRCTAEEWWWGFLGLWIFIVGMVTCAPEKTYIGQTSKRSWICSQKQKPASLAQILNTFSSVMEMSRMDLLPNKYKW